MIDEPFEVPHMPKFPWQKCLWLFLFYCAAQTLLVALAAYAQQVANTQNPELLQTTWILIGGIGCAIILSILWAYKTFRWKIILWRWAVEDVQSAERIEATNEVIREMKKKRGIT